MEQKKTVFSRRSFLQGTGAAVAGGVLGFGSKVIAAPTYTMATLPYGWGVAPDPVVVQQNAVYGYMKLGGCCIGAAYGMIEGIKAAGGAQAWTDFPVDVFKFGAGGALSWGTTCGALNGAAAVITLAVGASAAGALIDELFGWYQVTNFPSTNMDAFISGHADPTISGKWADWTTITPGNELSVCNSPLCHASVSTWCEVSGKSVSSNAKGVRCAKLTADVAAKAVELIVAYKASSFVATWAKSAEAAECYDCHGVGAAGTQSGGTAYQDAQGKMNCEACHDMPAGNATHKNKAPLCTDPKAGTGVGEI